jgi:hypothetical protein
VAREIQVSGSAAVQTELLKHFVSVGEASRIALHELSHANADTEGSGIFGVVLAPAAISFLERNIETLELIVTTIEIEVAVAAFYLPLGDRSPETMAKIAVAPGLSEMSEQDRKVYYHALSQMAWEKEQEKRLKATQEQGENWVVIWQAPKPKRRRKTSQETSSPKSPGSRALKQRTQTRNTPPNAQKHPEKAPFPPCQNIPTKIKDN